MKEFTPEIVEDIQMLATHILENTIIPEFPEVFQTAERVEAYLSNFKPDHL